MRIFAGGWPLTESEPTIKPYEESAWAKLEDAAHAPIEVSLSLLDSLHDRLVRLLRSVKPEEFARTFRHPEHGVRTLDWMLFLYDWHGKPPHRPHYRAAQAKRLELSVGIFFTVRIIQPRPRRVATPNRVVYHSE